MSDEDIEVKIQNIVFSVTLNQRIDLDKIAQKGDNIEYKPEQFPGLVYRLKKPKLALLIFSSGKMVVTGAKTKEASEKAVYKVIDQLNKWGLNIKAEPKIEVQNIVASADIKAGIDLEKATLELENALYEPEQFPGLIYRMDEPKVVLLLFSSGKLVCTGAKTEEEALGFYRRVRDEIREFVQTMPESLFDMLASWQEKEG